MIVVDRKSPNSNPKSILAIGPAAVALDHKRLRISSNSIWTAAPGKAIPPVTKKKAGRIILCRGLIY
ncbi:hypothetical protein F7734_46730 [Scytonema sp. UIC 10036]|uniref:hypothetical protein n=1 Tax=Scytonema sp. UIC 10036 TaxID=2304196 RepID=UPI0012DA9A27|nr:hypothetical protein [Scytonema sp. UIC 10036]MUG99391.1 hypothetical protein [Scytonema sp. UIC 10036]